MINIFIFRCTDPEAFIFGCADPDQPKTILLAADTTKIKLSLVGQESISV